ncbi:hypothetical protein LEL_03601 [Akanthomyces lecanii RCEF 1005]|uniref:Uncharacterized protein n=1 Tax=Akanthomyces lecanii RCEF 1005 TaxID=1081108 RepID=A0A168J854_CORDF|nr:hypothetical protein LEL_03601 [Akanthomyces lecanii RCEF 1005]
MSITLAAIAAQAYASIYPVSIPQGFFPGANNGVIGSWYRASAGQDATNGQSWCGYTYKNSDPIFAVSLKAMGGATYNSNPDAWRAQSRKYCGLEAQVTDPSTGKTSLLYIGDAFDDAWIKRTGSIDIMIDAFSNLHGNPNGNKNTVIDPCNWKLTGRVNTAYAAPGASWPSSGASSSQASPITSTTANPPSTSGGAAGASCDGLTKLCATSLTCLAPNGICSSQACNWGNIAGVCPSTPSSTCSHYCQGCLQKEGDGGTSNNHTRDGLASAGDDGNDGENLDLGVGNLSNLATGIASGDGRPGPCLSLGVAAAGTSADAIATAGANVFAVFEADAC